MSAEDAPAMIYGVPREEYMDMADNPAAMEEYAARMCPEMYVLALEMGTMVARVAELAEMTRVDRRSWREQHSELESRAWELNEKAATEEADEMYYWTLKAFTYGERAGLDQPMQKFEVQGVTI